MPLQSAQSSKQRLTYVNITSVVCWGLVSMKKILLTLSLCLFTGCTAAPCFAAEERSQENPKVNFHGLPVKIQDETSPRKKQQAQKLSAWVIKNLEEKQIKVAVITREGSPLAVLFDRTGMTHSGYVFKNPETGEWITYSLYSDPDNNFKTSKVWQQSVFSFYYGQSGKRTDSLMLVPSMAMQEKLLARLTAQPFKLLLPSDEHYSLVAPLENPISFNCTKWVLLQFFAARQNSDDTAQLIHQMATEYKEPVVKPLFIVKSVLKRKPDVDWAELSPPNHIHTVTVSSLLHSGLFEKNWFYHSRK